MQREANYANSWHTYAAHNFAICIHNFHFDVRLRLTVVIISGKLQIFSIQSRLPHVAEKPLKRVVVTWLTKDHLSYSEQLHVNIDGRRNEEQ